MHIPEGVIVKPGMRMKITDKKKGHSERFVVKAAGSIIIKEPLVNDYVVGSKI